MNINLVVAASENNVIGKNNKLLWHLPNDMAFFKNVTWGMPVIMGRKTLDSLGKPLKGRTNIVITRNKEDLQNRFGSDISVATSLHEAVQLAGDTDAKECFVIGGGEIYALALPVAHTLYLTRVHTRLEGDSFFPEFSGQSWELRNSTPFPADEKHAFPYTFEIWNRIG